MKKILKFFIILNIICVLSICFNNSTFADTETPAQMIQQGRNFIDMGKGIVEGNNIISANDISDPITQMAQVATTIGAGILLCVIAYMGIKWLQAKPDEQAKLKEQTIGILVAGIVILGGYSIWSIAIDIVKNL